MYVECLSSYALRLKVRGIGFSQVMVGVERQGFHLYSPGFQQGGPKTARQVEQ